MLEQRCVITKVNFKKHGWSTYASLTYLNYLIGDREIQAYAKKIHFLILVFFHNSFEWNVKLNI